MTDDEFWAEVHRRYGEHCAAMGTDSLRCIYTDGHGLNLYVGDPVPTKPPGKVYLYEITRRTGLRNERR